MYLSPRRIVLTRMKRGIRPLSVAESDTPVSSSEANHWEPALDALDSRLDETVWHGAVARLIVADHWVHYAIVPWSEALTDHDERIQHACHCLTKIYGAVVSQWTVTMNDAPPGALQVACAIPTVLLNRIQEMTEARGLRLKSVQPQLIAAFNGWRGRLPKAGGWFVTLEEGSLAAAHFNANGWDRVHSVRIGNDWEIELRRLQTFGRLARTSMVDGPVYVDAPDWLRYKAVNSNDIEWLDAGVQGGEAPERFALLQRLYA